MGHNTALSSQQLNPSTVTCQEFVTSNWWNREAAVSPIPGKINLLMIVHFNLWSLFQVHFMSKSHASSLCIHFFFLKELVLDATGSHKMHFHKLPVSRVDLFCYALFLQSLCYASQLQRILKWVLLQPGQVVSRTLLCFIVASLPNGCHMLA